MAKDFLTDEQVELEIERLSESPAVMLARQEQRIKYRRRQYMYQLRYFEKRGKELMTLGITLDNLEEMEKDLEGGSFEA